jgi:hypothetical protein
MCGEESTNTGCVCTGCFSVFKSKVKAYLAIERERLFDQGTYPSTTEARMSLLEDAAEESVHCINRVTGLRATHKLCVPHLLSINQISVGGLTANEYALDGIPLC